MASSGLDPSESLVSFVDACCDQGGRVRNSDFRDAYVKWCNDIKQAPLPQTQIGRIMRQLGYEPYKIRSHRGFKNIHLRAHGGTEARRRAVAAMSEAPDPVHNIPPGHDIKGVSSLIDDEGNVKLRWVKSRAGTPDPAETLARLRDEVESWGDRYLQTGPRLVSDVPAHDTDLMSVYPMGDPHIGMLAWRHETREDFDLSIAERNLVTATRQLVTLSPAAHTGTIIQLGDFFHANDQSNRTPGHGHLLDADGRHAKVMRVGIRTMVACIDAALEKHAEVKVYCLRGNHDPDMAVALSLMLEYAYRHEPRVFVCDSPAHYRCLEHGRCMIGMTHGDGAKPGDVPSLFACDWPEVWGRTRYRHVYSGHVHHEAVREYRGMTVETVRTLAAKDAWHALKGYRSDRSMFVDAWHRERGPIIRHRVGIEAIESAAAKEIA